MGTNNMKAALIKLSVCMAALTQLSVAFETNKSNKKFEIQLEKVPIKDDEVVGHHSEGMATTGFDIAYGHKYMGLIHIGSTQQGVNVTFDTNSPQVVVTSDLCDSTCKTKVYGQSHSISA